MLLSSPCLLHTSIMLPIELIESKNPNKLIDVRVIIAYI